MQKDIRKIDFEPVIAKGKRKEFFRDKVYEVGERIFDVIVERWKEVLLFLFFFVISAFIFWSILERNKRKKLEDIAEFERAMFLISSYDMTRDENELENSKALLSQVEKNPEHISKIYLGWVLSRKGEYDAALEKFNEVINSEDVPDNLKKIAGIMKINVFANIKKCSDVIETWKNISSGGNGREGVAEIHVRKEITISTPIRTYFEVIKCADDPRLLLSIVDELNSLYTIEQFLSPERARSLLMLKQFAMSRAREMMKKSDVKGKEGGGGEEEKVRE